MLESLLLQDEKIISSRKVSILTEPKFWIGGICLVVSAVSFVLLSYVFTGFLSLYDIMQSLGFPVGNSLFTDLPLIPIIFLVVGFLYVFWAEMGVYFTEYVVTNERIIVRRGIINKDSNILLPSKIEDVNVDINLLERVLGLGRVVIIMQQDSRPPVVLSGIREPYKFQGDIIKLIGDTPSAQEKKDGTSKTS
jgi:membrane protein YdbS with pleckstrin-like domain